MSILCSLCGSEFETESRLVVVKNRRYDTEEGREEVPRQVVCPDCKIADDIIF